MTVTHITSGKIYVEYVNDWGYPVKDDWSRRELNRATNISVLSVQYVIVQYSFDLISVFLILAYTVLLFQLPLELSYETI